MNEPRNTILVGDARTRLAELPAASVDCVVTSPPYFALRDYGADGQIGAESSVDSWVAALQGVAKELARVLAPHGALWLNLGDSYARTLADGAAPKSLVAAPERFLLALMTDGWILRNKVIWAKPNPLPSPVTDRLACSYEVMYLLVRSPTYYFDLDAIREPHKSSARYHRGPEWAGRLTNSRGGLDALKLAGRAGHVLGKNPGDVWTIPTRGFRGAHFATFPPALVRRPILATCPTLVCVGCGQPRGAAQRRVVCVCPSGVPTRPGLVLDPFLGAGTVGLVAEELGRDWLGIELNPDYVELAWERIRDARHRRAAA